MIDTLINNETQIVSVIIVLLIILGVVIAIVKVSPFIRKTVHFMNKLIGMPGEPGVLERLDKIEKQSAEAAYHSKPNHGGSAHDAVMKEITELRRNIELFSWEQNKANGRLWKEVEKNHGKVNHDEWD